MKINQIKKKQLKKYIDKDINNENNNENQIVNLSKEKSNKEVLTNEDNNTKLGNNKLNIIIMKKKK